MSDDILRCEDCADDLSALLDGELGRERAHAVRAHVQGCEACQSELAALGRVDTALASLTPRDVPGDLASRMQSRLQSRLAAPAAATALTPRAAPPRRPGRRWLARPAVAAALAAAAAIVLYLATGGEPTPAPAPVPVREVVRVPEVLREPPPAAETRYAREPVPEPEAATPAPSVSRAPEPDPEPEAETLAARVLPPSPEPETITREAPLEEVPDAELALALELDTIEDLEVIANLDLLEVLVALGEGAG